LSGALFSVSMLRTPFSSLLSAESGYIHEALFGAFVRILLVLRIPIVREEMRLPERKKSPVLDFSGAKTNSMKAFCVFLRFRPRFLLRSAHNIELSLPIALLVS
jgi:hypothetical protein